MDKPITKPEYVWCMVRMYVAANTSDSSDNPMRPSWMKGNECATHCEALEKIISDMGLGDAWSELLECSNINEVLMILDDLDEDSQQWEDYPMKYLDAMRKKEMGPR